MAVINSPTVFKEIFVDGFGAIEFLDGAMEKLWEQWCELINAARWSSNDMSMRTITPHLRTTRAVFARASHGGDLVGCVTWNECDGVTFISTYIVVPVLRGQGIGRIMWERACERFPRGWPQILRAVPSVQQFYRDKNGMRGSQNQHSYTADWKAFAEIFATMGNVSNCSTRAHYVSTLSADQFERLLEFDRLVTGRDRSEFLRLHYRLDVTEGAVIFDDNGDVCAVASGAPAFTPAEHLYKLCPVYAKNTNAASVVARKMVEWFGARDPGANVVVHILDGMIGDREFAPKFEARTRKALLSMTLFSGDFENPIKKNLVFVANNNSAHFDA